MNGSPACNDDLLKAMILQELPEPAGSDLLDHVEQCPHCRQRLKSLAGEPEEWDRAARLISSLPEDEASGPDIRPAGAAEFLWTDAMSERFLAPASHPEMLGRLGRYDIERLIGSGGMGVVFKAFDGELNRPVAVKLLAPYLAASGTARQRFAREARAAAAVVHHHVVPIHNVETDREIPLIVMQYVSGESLQDRIDREGPLELIEILRIGMQVADGLSAAHQQGLIHRDIKPSNILLEEDVDRALISDFGLARAADDASLTRSGFHPGTPQYMSPEQAAGGSIDRRSDLFSFGSTLYTMCTGRPPFRAENSLGVMREITESAPPAIRELNPAIPQWLCTLIAGLMEKEKTRRYASAGEVHELLEACLNHVQQPQSAALPSIALNVPPRAARLSLMSNRRVLMVSVLLIVSGFFGLFVYTDGFSSSAPATGSGNAVSGAYMLRPAVSARSDKSGLFEITVNGKQGFINKDGEVVIRPQFEKVYGFSEGFAAVMVRQKWGFIDTSGNMVIPPQFAEAGPFSDGLAIVRANSYSDPMGYIDTTGKLVIQPRFDCAEPFRKGIARVGMESVSGSFLSRIADVGLDCDFHFIDKSGNRVPEPPPEYYANGEADELIPYEENGLVGYVRADGSVAVAACFASATGFSDGMAVACLPNGKFGYIGPDGKFLIAPAYQYANEFSGGLAGVAMEGGKWGFIEQNGDVAIPATYDWIYGGFRDGLAQVTVAGRLGYVNRKGEWVW